MASLDQDRQSRMFHVRFRFGGRSFKRSTGTASAKLARAVAARVDETLLLLKTGRLRIPPDCDPAEFILSDGQFIVGEPRLIKLEELVNEYQQARIPGVKEANTIKTEDLHLRHLQRLLRPKTFVRSITNIELQKYVGSRLSEVRRGGRPVATETVRKEVATFRIVWNWAVRQGLLQGPAPVAELVYPKRDEKKPFMTWAEIERTIARNGMTPSQAKSHWESLYLTRQEVHEVLEYIRANAKHDFIYPLVLFVAHTGVRLSEAIRSRVEDIDLSGGTVLVREKKRSRVRAMTFRRVDLTPQLQSTLTDWLATHPGGPHTFCKKPDLRKPGEDGQPIPLTVHMAREHLKLTIQGSKWAKLRGFHVFRHSFASNLAAAGVDQRIIDEFMGHQTDEMRRRYRHLFPETKKAAIAKLLPEQSLSLYGN